MAKRAWLKWAAIAVIVWFLFRRVKSALAGPALDTGLPATTLDAYGQPVVYLAPKQSFQLKGEDASYISPYFKFSELDLSPADIVNEPTRTLALRLAYRLTLMRTGAFKGPLQVVNVLKRNGYWAAKVKRAPSAPSATDPVDAWNMNTSYSKDAAAIVPTSDGQWIVGPVGVGPNG